MITLFDLQWSPLLVIILLACMMLSFYSLYRNMTWQRQKRLTANIGELKLLRTLLGDFQRHRGLSTGLLAGDISMKAELSMTRARLDKSIHRAQQLNSTHTTAWQPLLGQWHQIGQGSVCDPAKNLLNHHELIRTTIFLFEDIAGELALSQEQQSYLSCIWQEVVQTAEWTGQARALGTGIAAERFSSAAQRVRLRFLHEKVQRLSASAFATLGHSKSNPMNLHNSREAISDFLVCLEQEFLNSAHPQIEAKLYFEKATLAINELLALVDKALTGLEQTQRRH
ncbi:nitrate- and nitrite sensing domain-containing protein [Neptunomonas antarctica]|uniref:Nitrate and nitrite sensing n=1 Tax=Neptunomonas antarctica TaxID=619304 RepID=A0A1N7LHP4_9GAMM|nr:nitrate- and nitrite sensing domain-containing protein [Neptunomonas antarctica]SIS73358.1 Nitrate and nitrite sensing [Neptunomonas antarctica]